MFRLGRLFFRGLAAVIPVFLTVYVVVWVVSKAESGMAEVWKLFLPERLYIPGMGILLFVVFIMLVGATLSNWIGRRLFGWLEGALETLPLIKAVYKSVKDLTGLFSRGRQVGKNKVVLVRQNGLKMLGLVTRDSISEVAVGQDDYVPVLIPYSYMVGGLTILVKKTDIEETTISVEHAMRLSLTAWAQANRD